MNRFILFSAILITTHSIYAEPATMYSKGFITRDHALHCIQMNNKVISSHQQLLKFESNKAHLKSKIDYLQSEIRERRVKIQELDQRNYQTNNKNYNQLIDQFEALLEERKQNINLYEKENQLHISLNNEDIVLQNNYNEQCINNIKLTKQRHKEVCLSLNNRWCSGFTF